MARFLELKDGLASQVLPTFSASTIAGDELQLRGCEASFFALPGV